MKWIERRKLTLTSSPWVWFRGVCSACDSKITAVARAPGEPLEGELRRPQVSRELFVEHEPEQRAASDAIEHLDASAVALGDQLDHV